MAIEHRSINDFTDAELAGMIRRGAYAANTKFGPGDSRFLLVLAVPYGDEDGVDDLPSALEAFFKLVQDDDYEERNFEVYDHNAGQRYFDARLEDAKCNRDEDDDDGYSVPNSEVGITPRGWDSV